MNFMLRFMPNYVNHLLAYVLENLCRVLYQKCCPVSPLLSRKSVLFRTKVVVHILFKVGGSLLCNIFYVMSDLFNKTCTTWPIV